MGRGGSWFAGHGDVPRKLGRRTARLPAGPRPWAVHTDLPTRERKKVKDISYHRTACKTCCLQQRVGQGGTGAAGAGLKMKEFAGIFDGATEAGGAKQRNQMIPGNTTLVHNLEQTCAVYTNVVHWQF